jgi:hypothetical protein
MSLYKTLFMHEQDYLISNYHELIETVLYSAIAFLVPFLLGHSQIVTGVIVNMALVLAALNLRNEKLLPVIFLPSIGAFARGMIFGPFTMYLAYMIPFIWVGNFLLVYMVKRLSVSGRLNSFISLGAASILKSAFIFAGAFALFSLAVIPQALLVPMGIMQLVTAALGGSLAIGAHELKKRVAARE